MIHLPGYRAISGNLNGAWTNGEYAVRMAATGTPASATANLPPFQLNLSARGNTNLVVVQTGVVSSAWAQVEISPGATIHFAGPLLQQPASARVSADLNGQSWIKAHGRLTGEIDLRPGSGKYPDASFRISGTNVGNAQVEAKTLFVQGTTHWPIIEIATADAIVDDGSSVHAEGGFDWIAKVISAGKATIKGPAPGPWLPAGYSYENGVANVSFAGSITNLSHEGRVVVTNFAVPQLEPLQVHLEWRGQDTKFQRMEVRVGSGDTLVQTVFAGEIERPTDTNSSPNLRGEVVFDKLTWKQAREQVFDLQKPARVSFEGAVNGWTAQVEDFEGAGTGGGLRAAANIQWPRSGDFELFLTNASVAVLNYFRKEPIEPTKIVQLELLGGWTNGPMVFDARGAAEATLKSKLQKAANEEVISARFDVHGDSDGLAITDLTINSETSLVAVARGSFPLTIVPAGGTNIVQLGTKSPANFELKTQSGSVFWEKFSARTGVVLKEPSLNVEVSGTLESPRGRALLSAEAIEMPAKTWELPRMEHLRLDLGMDKEVATLTNLSLLVQGQPVTATARLPLGESFWADLKERRPLRWRNASGRLQIEEAQIAAFSRMFPSLLTPQGTFHLDVSLQPGAKLDGELSLKQARTRPLANMGPIRDIDVKLRILGRTVKLAEAGCTIGGSPVMAAGEGDLSGTEWLKGVAPPFEFVLFGTNVPLSRQPESILRADLNLAVKKTNGAPALISGVVRVRNSFYLSDLSDLVPGRVSVPGRRPPYFSIENPGLADWRLAVRVSGERGLRVRSTLFRGEVSPTLRLQGTLKEPVALGDVKIEEGIVRFPFANLQVQRGYVSLTSEDPYRPQLNVSATSRAFGYDIRMDVTGPADQPVIQFNSTPALSSEQLVLMVTAGELPRGGYTLSPSQRAQTMALFLGKDLLNRLGFGDQTESRLTFTSGRDITETGRPTYSLQFKLTDRWSIEGEYDRFGDYNADFKWKVYSK
jgi:translocation and assembly module TamB